MAWNCVPLWRDPGPGARGRTAGGIAEAMAAACGRADTGRRALRIKLLLDFIPAAAAAGDGGMANLLAAGEPERSAVALADLVRRIPAIDRALG